MDQVRCGIVGVGGMGLAHLRSAPAIEELKVTAVSDASEVGVKRAADEAGVPGFNDYHDLLDSGLVDMVLIATPHYLHPPIAIAAFERGIHVLSEKPVGVTVAHADAMTAAARRAGKKFGVMYQMRSSPTYQAAHKFIQDGGVGEIYRTAMIMGWYRAQAYYESGSWRATWAGEGGGVLINQAPHLLDMFCWLGGLPSKIRATTRSRIHDIEVEDEAHALLEYKNGARGYLYASTAEAPGEDRVEICGDRGKLIIDGGKLRCWQVEPSLREFSRTSESMWSAPEVKEVEVEVGDSEATHSVIIRNFARAVLFDEPLIAPGDQGVNALELVNGIILSGQKGEEVSVPVDRAEYDALLKRLCEEAKGKPARTNLKITDPQFIKA